ncbi:MAG: MFS transporter [Burkholderiales bacterium]|nr:MFS transporter [Burkholderiales bacterium]
MFFSAQIISLLGSGVTTICLALYLHQLVGGASAAAAIGNALMLRILAFMLFSQLAGVMADRVNRKKILIAADFIRFGLLALFPFTESVWQIYALIFSINAATAFFTPTFEAALPEVVGTEHYVKALSFSRIATDVEAVAAPVLAGLLVSFVGLRWAFWFDAATYLASAGLVMLCTIRLRPDKTEKLSLQTFFSELGSGTRILLRESSLRRALVLSFAEATAGAAAIVATVVYVRDVLLLGETGFILTMAALGLGSTVSALLLSQFTGRYESNSGSPAVLHGKRHRWTEFALVAGGVLLGLLLLPGVWQPVIGLFAVLWFLNGAGQALIAISSSTLLAEHTKDSERGRVYAAYFAWTHGFWLITYPAIGHGTAAFGAPLTFTLAGMVCLVVAFMAFFCRQPSTDHAH